MSTRSKIGILNPNGTIFAIYSHWDNYPEYNGKLLLEHYADVNKVRELISYGSLSSLGAEIGDSNDFDNRNSRFCLFYGRDRGESVESTRQYYYLSEQAMLDDYGVEEYQYLYKDGTWFYSSCDDKRFKPLISYGEDSL